LDITIIYSSAYNILQEIMELPVEKGFNG